MPLVAKWQIEKMDSDKLGRQVTVRAVDFKPWSLELTINDLVIAKSDTEVDTKGNKMGLERGGHSEAPQALVQSLHPLPLPLPQPQPQPSSISAP